MKKTIATAGAVILLVSGTAGVAHATTPKKPKVYANCTAMNKVYPHGVGKAGAKDHTSGDPVTDFVVKPKLYTANKKSDRDGDGIACEKL